RVRLACLRSFLRKYGMSSLRPEASRGDFLAGSFRKPKTPDGVISRKSPGDSLDLVGQFPYAKAHVDEAVEAARKAAPYWPRLSLEVRSEALRSIQAELRRREEDLSRIIAREVGKPLWEAKTELMAMISKVDVSIEVSQTELAVKSFPKIGGKLRHKPL